MRLTSNILPFSAGKTTPLFKVSPTAPAHHRTSDREKLPMKIGCPKENLRKVCSSLSAPSLNNCHCQPRLRWHSCRWTTEFHRAGLRCDANVWGNVATNCFPCQTRIGSVTYVALRKNFSLRYLFHIALLKVVCTWHRQILRQTGWRDSTRHLPKTRYR